MEADLAARFGAATTFARTRQAPALLAVAVGLGLLTLWIGQRAAEVPTAGETTIPFWRFFVLGAAILPATGLYSPLHTLEEAAGLTHRRLERRYLWMLWLISIGTYLALVLPVVDGQLLILLSRCFLAWSGLALLSGRILGWRLSWVLPLAGLLPLLYWGGDPDRYWWDFTARPGTDLPSFILSAALLALGALAFEMTPWRRRSR